MLFWTLYCDLLRVAGVKCGVMIPLYDSNECVMLACEWAYSRTVFVADDRFADNDVQLGDRIYFGATVTFLAGPGREWRWRCCSWCLFCHWLCFWCFQRRFWCVWRWDLGTRLKNCMLYIILIASRNISYLFIHIYCKPYRNDEYETKFSTERVSWLDKI